MTVTIEPLSKQHDRAAFSCGQADLDDWFRHRATQDERRDMARVFVAVDPSLGVIGFYSLSSFALAIDDLPEQIVRRLPRYETVPAALIGRLARDLRVRGRGVGDMLVADAIRRTLDAGRSLAVFAIIVDAKDAHARAFYESFGFTPFASRPMRLYLPTAVAAKAFQRPAP